MNVTLFMSMSVNGMIGRPDGRGDFFSDICWHGFVAIAQTTGGLVWGRRTHDVATRMGVFHRDLVGTSLRGVVLTRRTDYPVQPSWETASTPRDALDLLAAQGGDRTLVSGGATVNAAFLREGLVDRITLFVEPVVIGQGMPLLAPERLDVRCRFREARPLVEGVVQMDWDVLR